MRSDLRSQALRAIGAAAAVLLLAVPGLRAQQTGTITGRVTDARSGQALASVQIYISGLDIGVLTQQNGRYLLQNVPSGAQTLTAERIGYQTTNQQVTVTAGGTAVQDFSLTQEALQLNEVIVTGTPGGTQKKALGNSVDRIDASTITDNAGINDMQDMLGARTPGLQFSRLDGTVGGGSSISIRGVSSVSLGNQPLIYIDGVRVDNSSNKGPNTGDNFGSSQGDASALSDLNPNEIQSIEVIKGPSAATLYGTEASAGVIQIITKKGSVGKPEFTFETSQGTNFMRHPQQTLGTQYACAVAVAQCPSDQIVPVQLYNEAGNFMCHQGRFAGLDYANPAPGISPTLAQQPIQSSCNLFGYGHSQRYTASVRGGTDQVRYYLSGQWQGQTGVLSYNTNKEANLRANITVMLNENLNLQVSTGYIDGFTQFPTVASEGGVWHQLVWGRPYNLPGVRSPNGSGFLGFQERFPWSYAATDITRDFKHFTGSLTATHHVGQWLTQRLVLGLDRDWDVNTEYDPPHADFPRAPDGALTLGDPVNQNITFDYSASGKYQLTQNLGTTTSVGAQYYRKLNQQTVNYGLGFPTAVQTTIDQTEFAQRTVSYEHIENNELGFYVQEELNWQDRLFLTGAVRGDDNSAFGSNFNIQYYPKLSGSWVISDEPFFHIDAINNLRLRAAWGESGRQPSTFASQTLYSTFIGPDGNGLVPTTAGNPNIGPEVSKELETGFDIAMFDQRLSGTFSFYKQTTNHMLMNQSLPPSTGLTGTRQANAGSMTNHGFEATLDATVFQRGGTSLDINLTGDHTTNKITSLGSDVLASGSIEVGWPYPNVYTPFYLKSAQMNAAGTAVDKSTIMCDAGKPAVSGGPNILQGGPTVPCGQYTDQGILLGPSYATYTFSVSPTLTLFNNLQIFALAQGEYGRWIDNVDSNFACRYYRSCLKAVERTDPMFLAGTSNFLDYRYNGRYPSSFWRLRQLGVRYNLPTQWVDRIGAQRASVSASGNNVFLLWQKQKTDLAGQSIFDPEEAVNRSSPSNSALWEMPGIASFDVTMRVTF